MAPGFLADLRDSGEGRQIAWHPGEPRPERASYLGIEVSRTWEVHLDADLLEVVTQYRCEGCGYIEAYAS